MGFLFDERKFINDNATLQSSRIASQYSRFLDSSPTYVTYYNVSNIESTVDYGFKNVEKVLGDTSPLRFNKVNNLPIYGIESLSPSLEDGEEGLNVSMDSNAILLPNTVKPRPNDFFIIDYLGKDYIFMVTNISFDGLYDDGYYNISYTLKYINGEKLKDLERQTVDTFTCYVDNIGTEDKVLIRTQDVEILNQLNKITTEISRYYLILFYDKKYNSLLLNRPDGTRLYDRLLTHFVNKNKVFFNRSDYETIHLTVEDPHRLLHVEYHNSIYRAIEQADPDLVNQMFYGLGYANDLQSIFFHWRDGSIRTTYFNLGDIPYIRPEVTQLFKDAREFYTYEKADEVTDDGLVQVSIPVNEGEVFTQDAGYGSKVNEPVKETQTEVVKPTENKPKLKLDYSDLSSILSPVKEEKVSVYNPNPAEEKDEEPVTEHTIEFTSLKDIKIEHGYKIPEGYDIVVKTITMYLSNNAPSLNSLEIDELLNYADYMRPNHETFILVPILLYVLENYYKAYLKVS